jgi:TRAP-type C4-dicarboxylate transport system substrate-binding protein
MLRATIVATIAAVTAAAASVSVAREKRLIEKWLDGVVKSRAPAVTYDGPPIQLKFSSFLAPTTATAQVQIRTFKRLEADTNSKVVVRPFWGSTLGNTQRGAFEAIGSGVAEFGSCYVLFNPGGFSLHFGLQLPYLFETSTQAAMTIEELYPKYFKKAYEARGVYLLRGNSTRPQHIISARDPVLKLEDLKGKKIWAPGGLSQEIATALGAVPSTVQASELYTAFQSGVLDHPIMHDAGTKLFRLMEIAKHRTVANFWIHPTEFCINKSVWDKLPRDIKAHLYHWARLANIAETIIYYDDESVRALKEMTDKGIKSHQLPPAEYGRFVKASEPVTVHDSPGARPGRSTLSVARSSCRARQARSRLARQAHGDHRGRVQEGVALSLQAGRRNRLAQARVPVLRRVPHRL